MFRLQRRIFLSIYLLYIYWMAMPGSSSIASGTFSKTAYLQYRIMGIYTCNDKCVRIGQCKSYDYNPNTLMCLLYTSTIGMYKKRDTDGPCSSLSCSETTYCVLNRRKQSTCVQDQYRCSDAPVIPHTNKNTKGYYVGAWTTYTCQTGYMSCVRKMTSTCESSGKWNHGTITCKKARWTKVKLHHKYRVPCAASTFTVSLFVTPTRRTRFNVEVFSGKNELLIASFVSDYDDFTNALGLNSRIDGKYRGGYQRPLQLTVGKELMIVIRYSNREFMVQADGSLELNYTCQTTQLPKHIRVTDDATVRLLDYTI